MSRISQVGARLGLKLSAQRNTTFRIKPFPALPAGTQAAIEMPWRLILAPHAGEQWRHAAQPVTSPVTQRTELWRSRLVAPNLMGKFIEPPRPDPTRTLRAVWALTGEGSDASKPMQGKFTTAGDLPSTAGSPQPFRATLSDFDRYQITHLSSNFSKSAYTPQPLDTNLMLLSRLGGWLDARGAWDPPGLSVEEWVHHASMGRDHYVRVVYKGYLFPFGHRVALIKVSERKFHNGRAGTSALPGNPAYLRQRMFIILRERERSFVDPQLNTPDGRSMQRQFPFNSVRIVTSFTPDINPPESPASATGGNGQTLFRPCVGGQAFAFRCVATDIDGRRVQFELPMIFMDNTMASPRLPSLAPDFAAAEANATTARTEWLANGVSRSPGWGHRRWRRKRCPAPTTTPARRCCSTHPVPRRRAPACAAPRPPRCRAWCTACPPSAGRASSGRSSLRKAARGRAMACGCTWSSPGSAPATVSCSAWCCSATAASSTPSPRR